MSFTFQNFVSSAGLVAHKWQQEAYDFCIKNEQAIVPCLGMKGGLIADEMGLGKTIVMLGLCACNQLKSTLIVLPTALIQQWHSQLTTFYEKAGINLSAAKANIDKIGSTSVKLFPKLKLYKINNIKNPKLIASSKYLGKIDTI